MEWHPELVVAAVDGSEASVRAARHAAAIARTHGARLALVTVVRTPEGWWGLEGAPPTPEALAAAMTSGQKEVLDRVAGQLDTTGIDVDTYEELGDPASMIVAKCEELSADLLVIGKRGASVFERLLMGSVADRVAHHAPCPLLIVP